MQKYGCSHYQRKCEILAPCCQIWYGCRHCHNENYKGPKGPGCKVEMMDRRAIQRIRCLLCKTEQDVSNLCVQCQVPFARYYCEICKLFDDDPEKPIYHCDKCGICRVGVKEECYHCDTCNCDYPIHCKGSHECKENLLDTNCPICFENLFHSTKSTTHLHCGHVMHYHCLMSYITEAQSRKCPLCSKSIVKQSLEEIELMDAIIESTREYLPPELKDKKNVSILCNDCLEKSHDCLFHFYGIKCKSCGSYNTRLL